MIELVEKELNMHGIFPQQNGMIELGSHGNISLSKASVVFKQKAKNAYTIVSKLWNEVSSILDFQSEATSKAPEGLENTFITALQGIKKMIGLYPGLEGYNKIEDIISKALCKDINSYSYKLMSKVIEYKIAIEWVGHLIARNLYIRSLILRFVSLRSQKTETIAKGVHGPYANLDVGIKERCFEWSDISEEVAGREKEIKSQRWYKMGLEGYNDPYVNEGFVWRELKNEPFLWGKEGENPYPHRNSLWS